MLLYTESDSDKQTEDDAKGSTLLWRFLLPPQERKEKQGEGRGGGDSGSSGCYPYCRHYIPRFSVPEAPWGTKDEVQKAEQRPVPLQFKVETVKLETYSRRRLVYSICLF